MACVSAAAANKDVCVLCLCLVSVSVSVSVLLWFDLAFIPKKGIPFPPLNFLPLWIFCLVFLAFVA